MGANCETCRPSFNLNQWAPANYRYDEVNQCEEPKNLGSRSGDVRAGVVDSCQCNGHSDRCGAIGQESWCVGCRDNTDGKTCSQCIPGFFSDPKLPTKGQFVTFCIELINGLKTWTGAARANAMSLAVRVENVAVQELVRVVLVGLVQSKSSDTEKFASLSLKWMIDQLERILVSVINSLAMNANRATTALVKVR